MSGMFGGMGFGESVGTFGGFSGGRLFTFDSLFSACVREEQGKGEGEDCVLVLFLVRVLVLVYVGRCLCLNQSHGRASAAV